MKLLLLLRLALCSNALLLASAQTSPPDARRLFEAQCALCHGQDGGGGRGPTLLRPTLPKAPDDKALALVISDGIDPEMPGAWQLSPNEVQLLVTYVRSLGRIAPEPVPGDPAQGRSLYARHGCASCHMVAGQGSGYGPELSTIGLRRNAAHLRASLVQPAAALPDGYSFLTLQTAEGRTVQGIRRNEDPFTIQVQDSAGRLHSFHKSSLRSLTRKTKFSPMPAYTQLNQTELQDLVAYLASLKGDSAQ